MPAQEPSLAHGVASGAVTRRSARLWTHWTGEGPLHLSVRNGDHLVTETDETVAEPSDRAEVGHRATLTAAAG